MSIGEVVGCRFMGEWGRGGWTKPYIQRAAEAGPMDAYILSPLATKSKS